MALGYYDGPRLCLAPPPDTVVRWKRGEQRIIAIVRRTGAEVVRKATSKAGFRAATAFAAAGGASRAAGTMLDGAHATAL